MRMIFLAIFLWSSLEAGFLPTRKPKPAQSGAEILEVVRQAKEALMELRVFYSTLMDPKYYRHEETLRQSIAIGNIHYVGSAMLVFHPETLSVSIVYGGAGITDGGFKQAAKFYSIPLPFMQALKDTKSILGFGRTHRGFYHRFQQSWDSLYRKIRDFARKQGVVPARLKNPSSQFCIIMIDFWTGLSKGVNYDLSKRFNGFSMGVDRASF